MTDKEKIGSQRFADAHLFLQWCNNFFEITTLIRNEAQIDKHHCRWFYIAIWELFENGLSYIDKQLNIDINSNDVFLLNAKYYLESLKNLYNDTDFFMLQYYRNSATHIFQHKYSYLDKNGVLNPIDRKQPFLDKSNNKIHYIYDEIKDIAKSAIGEYGLDEDLYRRGLISRCYDVVSQWEIKQKEIIKRL